MEARWLLRTGRPRVIVVFGGWAVGPEVFAHLEGDFDVLFVSGYTDLDADLPDLSAYGALSLIAWSFGVAAYGHWQAGRPDPFVRKIAVAGSLSPVCRRAGIPPAAMSRTIETLSEAAFQVFLARVFNAPQPAAAIDVAARREELLAVEARGPAPGVAFDRILICAEDRIFPAANLARAWAGQETRTLHAPHAPFHTFAAWEELLA